MAASKKYDLSGTDGASTFLSLPEGLTVRLVNGASGEIVGNPHNGAVLLIRFSDYPDDPSKVGDAHRFLHALLRSSIRSNTSYLHASRFYIPPMHKYFTSRYSSMP